MARVRRLAGGILLAGVVAGAILVAVPRRAPAAGPGPDLALARRLLGDRNQPWWNGHRIAGGEEPRIKGADVASWTEMDYGPPGIPVLPLPLARALVTCPRALGDSPFSGRALVVVDVRPRSAFFVERIPGSRNVTVAELDDIPADLDRNAILAVSGDRYPHHEVIARFRGAGFEAIYALEGGFRGWAAAGHPVETRADAAEYRRLLEAERAPAAGGPKDDVSGVGPLGLKSLLDAGADVKVVFVGDEPTFASGHIPGSVRVPMAELDALFGKEPKDRLVAIYCGCCQGRAGGFSEMAVRRLRVLGFTRVLHLDGHFHAWREAGFPVARSP